MEEHRNDFSFNALYRASASDHSPVVLCPNRASVHDGLECAPRRLLGLETISLARYSVPSCIG
jgi:hypothetical protein